MPPWTVSPGALCAECLKLPPDVFLPGSKVEHRMYQGPKALDRLKVAVDGECRLCAAILSAIQTNFRSSNILLDSSGILLKAEWPPLRPSSHKTRRYKFSAENSNLLLLENSVRVSTNGREAGPRLTLWCGSTAIGQMRFNVQQAPSLPPLESRLYGWSMNVRTHWDHQERAGVFDSKPRTVPPKPLAKNADCPETFELLNAWLDECQEQHNFKCAYVGSRVLATDFSLPTRLLYCTEEAVYLVDTDSIPRKSDGFGPPYTALSYRWGDPSTMPMTTKASIGAARAGIKLRGLPQTFRDLINVTRQIKVSYTWIDAMCIIQDDDEDKEREIGAMDLVYSMAICLISASASSDTRAGFLLPRAPNIDLEVRNFTLSQQLPKGPLSITVQPCLADWSQTLRTGLLTTRGWCFQERQMAKRIVHFTENRILWECRSSVACEDRPWMVPMANTTSNTADAERPFHVSWSRVTDTTALFRSSDRTGPWYREWCLAIEEYSPTELTYATDRLPALAGLAAHFRLKLGVPVSHYLAGLWREDFAEGLAWFPTNAARAAVATSRPREAWPPALRVGDGSKPITGDTFLEDWQPSWSWISFPGAVRYNYLGASTAAAQMSLSSLTIDPRARNGGLPPSYFPMDLTGVTITYPAANSLRLGRVNNGYLCLTSHLVVVSVSERHLIQEKALSGITHGHPKCYAMYRPGPLSLDALAGRRRSPFAGGAIYFDADPTDLAEVKIHCLRLGSAGGSLFSGTDGGVEFGLALLEIKNRFDLDLKKMGQPFPRMRRLGMFEIDVWNKRWAQEATRTSVIIV
ncbi:Heterokaryon incompatibility protein [Paramyrothecium foliicola]|nr:Heterokaryon incompatibility protein [Paramyrothecium foliicola]